MLSAAVKYKGDVKNKSYLQSGHDVGMVFQHFIFTPGGAWSSFVTSWVERLARKAGNGFTVGHRSWTESSFKAWAFQQTTYALQRELAVGVTDALTKVGAPRTRP